MADYDSGLPIRSEADGLDERVQVKIVDKDNPDTQQATVDTDNNVKVGVYGDRSDDNADVALLLSEEGRVNPRGDYEVDDNSNPASIALIAHTRNASKTEAHQDLRISGIDSSVDSDVTALDVAIRDESGNPFTFNNPLPVSLSESEGTEVNDYQTSAAVASDASVDHEYTVTALMTLVGDQVWVSGSGKLKVEVQIETGVGTDTYDTKFVAFNSTANPNIEIPMLKRCIVDAGVIVRMTITNRDNQPQDVYSTLTGVEKSA